MSVINDALKKTQAHLEEKKSEDPVALNEDSGTPPETTPPSDRSAFENLSQRSLPLGPRESETPSPSPSIRKSLATIEKEELERKSQMESLQSQKAAPRKSLFEKHSFLKIALAFSLLCLLSLGGLYVALSNSQPSFLSSLFPEIQKGPGHKNQTQQLVTVFSPANPIPPSASSQNPAFSLSRNSSPRPQTDLPRRTSLNLKGIITLDNKQFALINDGIYEEGSVIQGKKIMRIATDHVALKEEGEDRILTLHIQSESTRP